MICSECTDDRGFKRKCCGPARFTSDEKNNILRLGYIENDYFRTTNAGIFSQKKIVGRFINEEGVKYTVSRCVFLLDSGRCGIHENKPQLDCKNYPRNQNESNNCGERGFEGTGY